MCVKEAASIHSYIKHIDGLVQHCSNSIDNAQGSLQCCTKQSIYHSPTKDAMKNAICRKSIRLFGDTLICNWYFVRVICTAKYHIYLLNMWPLVLVLCTILSIRRCLLPRLKCGMYAYVIARLLRNVGDLHYPDNFVTLHPISNDTGTSLI